MGNLFFKRFLAQAGIDVATIPQRFNVIAGSSAGGATAMAYALGKTPDEIIPFFTTPYIFTIRTALEYASGSADANTPSNRPNALQKVGIISGLFPDPFYPVNSYIYGAVTPTSNYGDARLNTALTTLFGTNTMQNLQTNVLITTYEFDTGTPVFMSNVTNPLLNFQNETLVNAARATMAAPYYFPAYPLNGHQYIDGGICWNNPVLSGQALGQVLKPNANRTCILSIGSGKAIKGFSPSEPFSAGFTEDPAYLGQSSIQDFNTLHGLNINSYPGQEIIEQAVALVDSTLSGPQDAAAMTLALQSQFTLGNVYSYTFEPNLLQGVPPVNFPFADTELDNTDPDYLAALETAMNTYYDYDIANITNFIGHLNA